MNPENNDVIGASRARDLLARVGWLSTQPDEFQQEVFSRANPVRYSAGEALYQLGDAPGGIYGIVSGAVIVTVAPPGATPNLMHVLSSGSWIGEGSFLGRQPRRVGLHAALDVSAVYLPLELMDQMAGRDPMATRRFTQILLANLDIALRAFYDLQDPDEHRRVARSLRRIGSVENATIPLSQSALGLISNASRKTVNATLNRFEEAGWVRHAYRSVTITDFSGLSRYADGEIDERRS